MTEMLSIGARAMLAADYEARRAAGLPPARMEEVTQLAREARTLRALESDLRARRFRDMPVIDARRFAPHAGGPASLNHPARSVEVVWATGARARNFVPTLGMITEELEMSPNAVRMDVLRSGRAPVLDTHRRDGAGHVLGRVTAARLDRGRGYATLQFSSAADVEPVWQRVVDGTLRSVSAGYRVHRYEQRHDAATGETIHRAVDWEPYEISLVPIPVDPEAMVQ